MLELLRWNKTKHNTKETARDRLKNALAIDRFDLAPDIIEALRQDIKNAVSRYMVVADGEQQLKLRKENESIVLTTSISITEVHRWANTN
jgi:cell division topological specificity factor MinE